MYQHMSLQIVQSIELATTYLALEFFVWIMMLLMHTQVSYVMEGFLTYITCVLALLVRHM